MEFQEHVSLAQFTTLQVGGPARWLANVSNVEEVLEGLQFARERDLPIFVMGSGSNLLVLDEGFPGLILRIGLRGVSIAENGIVEAAAGEDWDSLVAATVARGLGGFECMSGIPGTVGGTPVQNVGAYGQEVASEIERVDAIEIANAEPYSFSRAECGFGYRSSRFNKVDTGRFIILKVCYKLQAGAPPSLQYPELRAALEHVHQFTIAQVREAVLRLRRRKGMLLEQEDADSRSAGSFFKNPVVSAERAEAIASQMREEVPRFRLAGGMVKISAAWLIERAGFARGFNLGQAGISSKHTLALINRGCATAGEIETLRDWIVARVEDRFAIRLQQEPVTLRSKD